MKTLQEPSGGLNAHGLRDAVIHAAIGAVFGMALLYTVVLERDREIGFLRGEYFAAHGLAQQASDTAEKSVDLAISLAAELTDAKREQTIERLTRYVAGVNPRVPASRIARALVVSAETHGLDVTWWAAQIEQESHFDSRAVSRAGAVGLAQIMPATARALGLDWSQRFHIEANLHAGARYMAQHLQSFKSIARAQHRYSGGEPGYAEQIRNRRMRIKAIARI